MSDTNLMLFLGICIAFTSMAAVRASLGIWKKIRFEQAYRRYPRVIKFDRKRLCSSQAKQHNWYEATLAVRNLNPGRYTICLDCGVISGNEKYMVSDVLIEQAKETLEKAKKQEELEKQIYSRILAIVDHRVTEFIMQQFPKESNDPTFVNKLLELADLTLKTQDAAVEKIRTEYEINKSFDLKSNLGDDIVGNA